MSSSPERPTRYWHPLVMTVPEEPDLDFSYMSERDGEMAYDDFYWSVMMTMEVMTEAVEEMAEEAGEESVRMLILKLPIEFEIEDEDTYE